MRTAALPTATTWSEMLEIEPKLADVMSLARSWRKTGDRFWQAYERNKRRLKTLVGWYALDPRLSDSTCYEIAVAQLLEAMEGRS